MIGLKQRFAAFLLFAATTASATGFLPHRLLSFDPDPSRLEEDCRAAKKRAESALAAIANLPPGARTFDNTPWALDRAGADLADETATDTFLKYVSVSSSVRASANECETLLGQFAADVYARPDLYRALSDYAAKGERLAGENKRLLDKQLLEFKRSGMALSEERRGKVLAARKELVALEADFGRNINESADFALFAEEDLDGLPADYISRLELRDGKRKVSLDYPDYFPFMDNARNPAARRLLEGKFNNRAARLNLPILSRALALRLEAARLLGYATHAHFILEERMAKDPKTVAAFIANLRRQLEPLANAELAVLKSLKFVFEGPQAAQRIEAWDWRFYDNLLKTTKYSIDAEKIREYFPAQPVIEQMLVVYQTVLGLTFRRIDAADAWHPDVKLYEIVDAAGGEPIAYFYLDLFPRPGKYKHAAAFPLIAGRSLPDGHYQKPVSALVANFDRPSQLRPSLLSHDEVVTLFHEFGHIMHQTLTKARFARFSGSATARDFVEAPSQMLENWAWTPAVLHNLSGHYLDRSKKLPQALLDKMLDAKNVDSGLYNLRQLVFASVDQAYHAKPPKNTTEVFARVAEEVGKIPTSPEAHPEASFEHLMGYDAAYYGYMWSKVYAEDMFSVFKNEGVLNPATGRRYRTEILERGSSRDEMESLKAFLRREPSETPFLESIGLGKR